MRSAIRALMLLVSVLALPSLPSAASGMTVKEATDAASKLFREFPFEVVSVKKSPLPGLWEAGLIIQGRHRLMYIDDSGSKIIFPGQETMGQLIDVNRMASLTNESIMELGKIEFKKLPLDDAIIIGKKKAKNRVAVFDDPY